MIFADAHCHLTNINLKKQIHEVMARCSEKNIDLFLQGGISPDEWMDQLKLHERYPSIKPIFGLHPMWVATQSQESVDDALEKLAKILRLAVGVGEVGLDFRPQYKDSLELQLDALQNQVELAQFTKLPVVWHLVQCFDFIKNNPFVSEWFQPGGFVHAFNGSWQKAQFYLNHGLLISIGGALTHPKNIRLHEVVRNIPLESLLIETDSPDQKNFNDMSEFNYPYQIWETAQIIADLRGLKTEEILAQSTENLKRIFKI